MAIEMAEQRILLLALGATALLARSEDEMHLSISAQQLVNSLSIANVDIYLDESLAATRTGAQLTLHTLCSIRDVVCRSIELFAGFCVLIGTDTMDEAAFALGLMLEGTLRQHRKCLVLTGGCVCCTAWRVPPIVLLSVPIRG